MRLTVQSNVNKYTKTWTNFNRNLTLSINIRMLLIFYRRPWLIVVSKQSFIGKIHFPYRLLFYKSNHSQVGLTILAVNRLDLFATVSTLLKGECKQFYYLAVLLWLETKRVRRLPCTGM